ncbi:NmrA family NAD(P)-binding protein [Flavobacterium sp. LC2016-01]|uniref:NmrA family NAD(P)-binding protein n=1 Tax=Flavobacterium sp. LC2016-01 TaxID=2675876 RepID=UPI0012BAB420|nr:NmrA family NAD(P)-binding protein [Flavobacterium sp. LC2016-01]MTH15855.1 NAD(P)H-binding protein [Flavobacterium sp. LC2016-01]
MKNKVLITGATGATGRNAIKTLLALNIPVRALVHKIDERSDELEKQGVEIFQGDLLDFEAVSKALEGIDTAYFVYPIQVPGILEATAFFAQAAIENGVNHILNMSQISARRIAKSHAAQNHWLAERLLDRSGVPVTHIRPTFFAEWLMYFADEIRLNNRIVLPFGDGVYAPIAAEDQGRVIAAILSNPKEHIGKTYPLYGPVEMSQYEIAAALSKELGRNIEYIPIPIENFKEVLSDRNFSPWFIQHISNVAQDCRDGIFAGTNKIVEELTGQAPLAIEDYISKNKKAFQN